MSDTLIQHITHESLTETSTGETVLHAVIETELIEQGIMGPPGPAGPAGPQGPPGIGTASPWQESVFTLAGDQTVFTLPATPATGTVSLFTNGLRETRDNFSVVGSTVTITGFIPTTGDVISFVYQA